MNSSRRFLLKLLAALAASTGMLRSGLAARRGSPGAAPEGGAFRKALTDALGGRSWVETDRMTLEVPQLAENGAIVPITVESSLPGTRRIFIFAEKNPGPLLASFRFEPGTDAWISLRIKLNETGPVLAVAVSDGRVYGRQKSVRVMLGGCG